MEMRSSALRPRSLFSCVIASSIVLLLFLAFLVPFWIHRMNNMSNKANSIIDKNQQELLSRMKDIEKMLPTKREITNLQRYLSSSLNATDLPFSDIETKVAPKLFLAFSTIQYLEQISYIGSDGLLFSYCIKGDQPFAVYSNTTFSTHNYSWYTQPVTKDMGKLYGDPLQTSPIAVLNSSTFRKGHVTVGSGLSNDGDLLLLDTVDLDGMTSLSLGFSLKPLTNFFSTSINSSDEGIYLATNDGTSLFARGILSTQMVQTDTSTSVHLSGDKISKKGDLTCQHNGGNIKSSALEIKNREYIFHCSSLEIVGVQFVCAIALPYDGLASLMKQNVNIAVAFSVIGVISIVTLIYLTIRAAVREMYLCAALIKHMEATQQAERKSINKSLSLARASHDVRNYISAIVNMVQHACGLVAAGSDLERELKQVETTTETLLNTLNSILDNSKIEAGKAQLEEVEFDLEQLLEEVVDLFYSVGIKKGVDVVLDPCDGTASKYRYVKGDIAKLKQILSNLLSNAVKFTAEGHVAVRVWASFENRKPSFENEVLATNRRRSVEWRSCLRFFKRDDEALKDLKVINHVQQDPNCVEFIFEVSDTGKGIPTEKHQMVFENYVQDKDKGDIKHEGTGLGLGIVQTLVRIMGGEIAIVEKKFGERGTCFRFNTFFIKCESKGSNDDAMEDVRLSTHRDNSPKVEGSHVVLFIPGEERSKISKKFMENLGVKVSVVKKYEDLYETLKRTRQKHTTSSMRFAPLTRSISSSSTSSWKEMSHSAFDGADDISSSSMTNFVLVVIDTSAATFRQISQAVAKFRREHSSSRTRIVYIHRADKDLSLGRENLPLMDVIISQPFHGSRLFQVLRLLPEFGGKMPATNVREGISYLKFKRAEKNNEIEEIGSSNKDNPKPSDEQKVLVVDDKPLHGKKVLLVEDNVLLRKIATGMLSKIGADIEACENGEEALQMVVNKLRDPQMHPVPDYILMDCEMSVMDGYEATKRIREEEKKYGLHIPIIAVTGHTGSEEKRKIIEAGMDIHLSKPLKVDQLLSAISTINSKAGVSFVERNL